MRTILILISLLMPAILRGQDATAAREPGLTIRTQTVIRGGGENGGGTIIRRVEPIAENAAKRQSPLAVPKPDPAALARFAALRAAAPTELRLFTPRVTVFGGGHPGKTVSMIEWWASASGEYQEYRAWSVQDFSDIQAVGDLTVNRRRYVMLPSLVKASERQVQQLNPPLPDQFAGPQSFILEKGEAANEQGLEPLRLLLASHEANSLKIAADFAALRKVQEETEAAAKLPKQPVDAVIQYYTTDADAVRSGSESK